MHRIKGGQAKMALANIIWHSQNMTVQTPDRTTSKKEPANHAYSSSFWLTTPSIYTKVDTVARASTCDGCFRRVITDTKRIYKYVSWEDSPGHPNTAVGRHKEKDLVLHRPCTAQVPVSMSDRMASWSLERQPYDHAPTQLSEKQSPKYHPP